MIRRITIWSYNIRGFPLHVHSGFTLIELLIVIAILGVLAGAILVAINPTEQLKRARDAGKQSVIDELGHGLSAYYTTQNSVYPATGGTWIDTLKSNGDIKTVPSVPIVVCANVGVVENGYCYQTNATPEAIVYAPAESRSLFSRAACAVGQQVWIVWSSAAGKTGVTCTANATTYPAIGLTALN